VENQCPVSAFFQKDDKTRTWFLLYFKRMGKPGLGFCFISKRWENQGPVSTLFQNIGKPGLRFCFISKDWENRAGFYFISK